MATEAGKPCADALEDDEMHEECGVFGVFLRSSPDDSAVASLCHLGLFALQHRGQESCGICVASGAEVRIEKGMGLVAEVFTDERLARLAVPGGRVGLGHTRYSTSGSSKLYNAQPLTVRSNKGVIALAHNGNFTNAAALREAMLASGAVFQTTNDSEVMLNLIARYSRLDLRRAAAMAMSELEGGFSVVLLDQNSLIALRDRNGVRPLVIGELDDGFVFASEPAALSVAGARYLRDVRPGEMVVADDRGLHSEQVLEPKPTPCSFEWIYFARGDSVLEGVSVHASRVRMGEVLADEAPVPADVVVGVPESGMAAALGYAKRSGIPYDVGFYRSPYAGRSFIDPTQGLRERKVRLKLAATTAVQGKSVVLVDDSIVRGTTSGRIVNLLLEAGATEVHFRVSSPPIRYPCYYGIDTSARKELAAATLSVEQIRQRIGATTLAYLSEPGLMRALGMSSVCLACFDGKYPAGTPRSERRPSAALAQD